MHSDLGFNVQFTGRFDAEYRVGDNMVELYVESGIEGGLPCIIIEPNAFAHWSDGQPIDTVEQAQMLKNFKEAMQFQGLKTMVR